MLARRSHDDLAHARCIRSNDRIKPDATRNTNAIRTGVDVGRGGARWHAEIEIGAVAARSETEQTRHAVRTIPR
jgi:hypothetical protein